MNWKAMILSWLITLFIGLVSGGITHIEAAIVMGVYYPIAKELIL